MSLLISTSNNAYLVSPEKGCLLYIHPVMYEIISMHNGGIDISCNEELEKNIDVPKEYLIYYRNKLKYYESIGFSFDNKYQPKRLAQLCGKDVENFFFNTPQIVFELTEACNMQCKYCVYGDYYKETNRQGRTLDAKQIISVIELLLRKSGKTLNIGFYGGEPLLRFEVIKKVVDHFLLNEEKGKIRWRITTNATLMNKVVADYLVTHKFSVLVSLDGDENCNTYRVYKNGKSTFVDVMSNVLYIQDTYPDFFAENVRFNAVLHKRNSVDAIYSFFISTFGISPSIAEMTSINQKAEKERKHYLEISSEIGHSKKLKEHFDTSPQKRALLFFLRTFTKNYYLSFHSLIRGHSMSESNTDYVLPTGMCLPFQKKVFVTSEGKIKPCEKIPMDFSFGRIKDDSVELPTHEIAEFYNNVYKRVWHECSTCWAINNCSVCAFFLENVLDAKCSLCCNRHKNNHEYSLYVAYLINILERNYSLYLNCINTIFE